MNLHASVHLPEFATILAKLQAQNGTTPESFAQLCERLFGTVNFKQVPTVASGAQYGMVSLTYFVDHNTGHPQWFRRVSSKVIITDGIDVPFERQFHPVVSLALPTSRTATAKERKLESEGLLYDSKHRLFHAKATWLQDYRHPRAKTGELLVFRLCAFLMKRVQWDDERVVRLFDAQAQRRVVIRLARALCVSRNAAYRREGRKLLQALR